MGTEQGMLEEAPLPLALVCPLERLARWHVGMLARWAGSESKRQTDEATPTPKVWGQEVGELETGQGCRPRHTLLLGSPGPGVPEKQGSGCISGQLQRAAARTHLQATLATTGPHGIAGSGWTARDRETLCGPLGPERADRRWAVSENGSAFCAPV